MINILKSFKYKHLLTLNMFVNKTKVVTLTIVQNYCKELSQRPKREDFIPYNMKNEFIKDHKPMFKNWTVCDETSDVKTKVAKLMKDGKVYRIYFGTKEGVVIMSELHITDKATYNDLAIFFEGKLELN